MHHIHSLSFQAGLCECIHNAWHIQNQFVKSKVIAILRLVSGYTLYYKCFSAYQSLKRPEIQISLKLVLIQNSNYPNNNTIPLY